MASRYDWKPVMSLLRKHLGLLALSPFLLSSCQADDPTADGVMTEPGCSPPATGSPMALR